MTKQELRLLYLEKRKTLSKPKAEEVSELICAQFFSYFKPNAEHIHLFLPIQKHKEVNTRLILKRLMSETSCTVVASKSNFSTFELEHFVIDENTVFEEDSYGIPTPVHAEIIDTSKIDWVLVPLLCFDKNGYRVGYGKGFYDRFIIKCRPDVKTIGLSAFEPITNIDDSNAFDQRLDYCITPKTIYHFKR